jgi:hypothetical protein
MHLVNVDAWPEANGGAHNSPSSCRNARPIYLKAQTTAKRKRIHIHSYLPDAPHFAGRTETHEPTKPGRDAHRGDGTLAAHFDAILRHCGKKRMRAKARLGARASMSLQATDMQTGGYRDERRHLPPPVPRPASGIGREWREQVAQCSHQLCSALRQGGRGTRGHGSLSRRRRGGLRPQRPRRTGTAARAAGAGRRPVGRSSQRRWWWRTGTPAAAASARPSQWKLPSWKEGSVVLIFFLY